MSLFRRVKYDTFAKQVMGINENKLSLFQLYIYIYINGLARPQGRPPKKKTLSKIPHYAPKPNVAARTLYHGKVGFFTP